MLKRIDKADIGSCVYLLDMVFKVKYDNTKRLLDCLEVLERLEKDERKRLKEIPW